MIVAILTGSYPYSKSAESTFLDDEVRLLLTRFDRVVLVPLSMEGGRSDIPLGADVDTDLAKQQSRLGRAGLILHGLFSRFFLLELIRKPSLLLRPIVLIRSMQYLGRAKSVASWAERFSERFSVSGERIILYSFWLNPAALGLALAKRKLGSGVVSISRAHGGDLYEERHVPAYIPFRGLDLDGLDWIAPDSTTGTDYLRGRYPHHAEKITEALMGVRDPGRATSASLDGRFRIVSCSFLVDVKRIDLLIRGVAALASRKPDCHIKWDHFGDGPNMARLVNLAASAFPPNVVWKFHGHLTGAEIYAWYELQPVDAFVNVSESEGTPVSIMEAISFSIPVIATSVGGNTEAVTNENGIALNPNPTADEIAEALETLMLDTARAAQLKGGSRRKWASRYSAEVNYRSFSDKLELLAMTV